MGQALKPRFQHLGAFAGTPEFASPKQFAGIGMDNPVRSVFTRCHTLGDVNRQNAIPGSILIALEDADPDFVYLEPDTKIFVE